MPDDYSEMVSSVEAIIRKVLENDSVQLSDHEQLVLSVPSECIVDLFNRRVLDLAQ